MVYMGSKNRIAKDILAIMIPDIEKYGKYVEPFCGGCNMIDKVSPRIKRWANDSNRYLIALLSRGAQSLSLPTTISKEEYDAVRTHKNDYPDWYVGFVGFICTFNGKFFGGYGRNNVLRGNGKIENFQKEHINNFLTQCRYLKGIDFTNENYKDLDITDSVIYCDPPYAGATKYKEYPYQKVGSRQNFSHCRRCNSTHAEGV